MKPTVLAAMLCIPMICQAQSPTPDLTKLPGIIIGSGTLSPLGKGIVPMPNPMTVGQIASQEASLRREIVQMILPKSIKMQKIAPGKYEVEFNDGKSVYGRLFATEAEVKSLERSKSLYVVIENISTAEKPMVTVLGNHYVGDGRLSKVSPFIWSK